MASRTTQQKLKKPKNRAPHSTLYIMFQDLVRQMSKETPEQGLLLMRIFKRMQEENERSWLKTIQKLAENWRKVKNERDLMLGKYLDETDLKTLIDNNEDSVQNLARHKQIINSLVG